ncbi:MAG: long-chain acyl-CoA synthetase [Candidatus Deianiraeaceae bacterium]|jgi:long-chain acyl-CoA synthetase
MKEFQALFNNNYPHSIIANGKNNILYIDLYQYADRLRTAMHNIGITFQSKIMVVSQSSIEWILCDIASIKAGFITIPTFADLSQDTIRFQIEDCQPDYLIVENEDTLQHIQSSTEYKFKKILSMEEGVVDSIWNLINNTKNNESCTMNTSIEQSSIATIIYTSGTSGNPKGVMLSYSNLAHQLSDISSLYPDITNKHRSIAFLPFAHIFQRTIIYFYLSRGVNIHIVNDVSNILSNIKSIQPHLITIVPRVLEKIYARIKSQISSKPSIIKKLFLPMLEYSSNKIITNKLLYKIFDILLFKKVQPIFGKEIKLLVCGGAKLNPNEEIFFYNANIPVLQGYGMTECSPVIASNTSVHHKIFTVGKPLPSIEVQIAQNGEICIRGGSVFIGYYGQDNRDTSSFFHTGDIGSLDEKNFLTVTGRLKEQFKNSNGKYINPIKIESLLNEIDSIQNACIVAEGRPFTIAILFTQINDVNVIQKEIDEVNKHLDHHEKIQYFHISNELPSVANNIITPSMKIRRENIVVKFHSVIENIYSNR